MRWFKHLTTSQSDAELSALIDEFGLEGYGLWWSILEKIAHQMDEKNNAFLRFSLDAWSKSTRISTKKFKNIVNFLEKKQKLSLIYDGRYLTVECKNLLKFRDEWASRKSKDKRKTPELLTSGSGVTQEQDPEIIDQSIDYNNIAFFENDFPVLKTEIKTKRKDNELSILQFEEFYKLYPLKKSRKCAEKAFLKRNFTDAEFKVVLNALQTQIKARNLHDPSKGFMPSWAYPSTWLNGERWQDLETSNTVMGSSKNHHDEWLKSVQKTKSEQDEFEQAKKKDEESYLRWKAKHPELFEFENQNLTGLKRINARVEALRLAKEREEIET